MLVARTVKKAALRAGFDLCGIAPGCNLSAESAHFDRWLAEGHHGGLEWLGRGNRFTPTTLLDGVQSVIICAVSYRNALGSGYPAGWTGPKVSSYAILHDYHNIIWDMLRLLGEELSARFGSSGMKNFCDTAPLSEKSWAVRAGLGWQGRNSLLINPGAGSYLFLGGIVTDMPADIYDKPYAGTGCGECRRCVDACPAGAILPEGNRIDAGRCISKLTVERCSARKGSTEKDSVESFSVENGPAPRLDGWIFGCDECQSVCPHNISAPMFRNPAFAPIFDPLSLDRHYWLSLSEEEFRAGFSSTPLARAGLERIKSMFRVC